MVYYFLFIVPLLVPYPSVQHFVWPLHWCLLADICNHTYIPECGTENEEDKYNRRLFIDECDLFEYNCDYETDFYPINYSSCFNLPPRPCPPVIPCPSIPPCPDHRYHTDTTTNGVGLVSKFSTTRPSFSVMSTTPSSPPSDYYYEDTRPTTRKTTTTPTELDSPRLPKLPTTTGPPSLSWSKVTITTSKYPNKPTTSVPSLPPQMLKGKRRYSPTFKKKKRKTTRQLTTARKPIKKNARRTTRTQIIKKITVKKNGRVFIKVFKAIIMNKPPKKKKHDSDFLE